MQELEEMWKTVNGFDNFQVSNLGRVRSLSRQSGQMWVEGRLMKLLTMPHGYVVTGLSSYKTYSQARVHKLVATAFIPNPENKPEINHKNFIKTDNRAENLEWCTAKENRAHIIQNGRLNPPRGSKHWRTKLTEDNVLQIKAIARLGIKEKEIADYFGVQQYVINRIVKGINWKHIGVPNSIKTNQHEQTNRDKWQLQNK